MKKLIACLLAAVLLLSLAACGDKKEQQPDDYKLFTQGMADMRDAGNDLAAKGLDFQAQSLYAFSGASLSSMRYAVEYILWLKGEGGSIEDVTEGSRYAGWDEIAAICYASPYPYYFEGLVLHMQDKNNEAKPCYAAALLNPAYPEEGVDFWYLKDMAVADLYKLRDELRVLEQSVYDLYTPRPVMLERDQFNFYPDWLRAKSAEALEAGDNMGAFAYAKVALLNDPFEPLNFRNAVLCAVTAGDMESAVEYLNAGLFLTPEDEGLLTLKQGFSGGGN